MFSKQKGITPVIAIVLLLLVTVGAVGVVYTQFQDLTSGNEAQEQLREQQKIQQSSYKIIAVQNDSSSGVPGEFEVTLKNTGENTVDLDQLGTLQIGVGGASPQAVAAIGSGCSFGQLAPGATASCSTGVQWPSTPDDGQDEQIVFLVKNSRKDTMFCDAGQDYC